VTQEHRSTGKAQPAPIWLRAGFWLCILIAAAAVVRRLIALANPSHSGPPQLQALDNYFAAHALLTRAHIIPALMFVVLVPVVLFRWTKSAWPQRALYLLGVIVGITAYAMSTHAVGGWVERSAVLTFDTWFLVSLGMAWHHALLYDAAQEHRWLLRAIVVLLGIATTRPVMGIFFATSRLTHLTPNQFFGIAFWIGFSINTIVIEWWLGNAPPKQQKARISPRLLFSISPSRKRSFTSRASVISLSLRSPLSPDPSSFPSPSRSLPRAPSGH
jgi:hypothetical protein